MTDNRWNNISKSSEIARNFLTFYQNNYESEIVFNSNTSIDPNIARNTIPLSDVHMHDAISFLGSDTELLVKNEQEPVAVRVVWNLLENTSRVYFPRSIATDEPETICLSVKGDPYSVRENGVMLDALNYVRMLFSEQSGIVPAY
ncbi:hypothetical protein [Asaia prunellae]|uniref:hypothetical protein n=1 Tax=Asaia prunellae TaxID=610245 RepID=UPI0011DCECCE|nr:hypothetical protein [Asaia prunellae]